MAPRPWFFTIFWNSLTASVPIRADRYAAPRMLGDSQVAEFNRRGAAQLIDRACRLSAPDLDLGPNHGNAHQIDGSVQRVLANEAGSERFRPGQVAGLCQNQRGFR